MTKRLIGYAIAGGILIGVSILSAYVAHTRGRSVGAPVNLDFVLKDMNGADVRLSDFRGKPLLVNFWGTWCGPCVLETPQLVELADEYRDRGLVVIGIAYNDTPEDVKRFAAKFGVKYPLLMWTDPVMDAFGVTEGFPTSVFVHPDGRITVRQVGLNTKAGFEKQIATILGN